ILVNVFPTRERAKAIAIWAATTGAAGAFGPVASGFLLGHFWYGAIFLINVPIVLVALVAGSYLGPRSKDPEQAKLDPLGALLSTVGIATLVYGLIEAPDVGWSDLRTLAAFGIAFVVLALFVLWELRVDEPMLEIRFFRKPAFSTGTGGMALSMSPMTSAIMSAVPPRRAGAGSAMNDATRELGAALGVAVLGSLAASRYATSLEHALAGLSGSARATARASLAGALDVAK